MVTIALVIALLALVFFGGGAAALLIAVAALAFLGASPVGGGLGP